MSRPRPRLAGSAGAARRRRRRLWPVAGGAATVLAVVIAVLVSSSGGAGSDKTPVVGPGGSASVITPPSTSQPELKAASTEPFAPAPAAVALAGKLPLPSQVAQLFMVSVEGSSTAGVAGLGSEDWGGVVLTRENFSSDGQIGTLAAAIGHAARTPALIAATQEGGSQTAFPDLPPEAAPVIGASGQPAVAQAQARLAGRRLKQLGVDMTIAPLADVDTPDGPLSGRLFSADPRAVARFAAAAVSGYAADRVVSAVGHFPGAGAASADPDQMTATVGGTLAQLRARDLIPFTAIAGTAPVIVMSNASYVAFDGVTPASLLGAAVTLLRHDLGFQGVVMSDDLDATLDPTAESPGAVALQALAAGDDLLYITGPATEHVEAYQAVLSAAEHSAAIRARVRDALLRDLTLKARYGLIR